MDVTLITCIAVGLIFVLLALGTPVFAALALSGAFGIVMVEPLAKGALRGGFFAAGGKGGGGGRPFLA